MITILGTTRDQLFSNTIRNITEEPISHVAIELFGTFVVHSNFRGVGIQSSAKFRKDNVIIVEITPFIQPSYAEIVDKFNDLMKRLEGSGYDTPALMFIGVSMLARRFLKIPLPKSNLWQSSGMFICTEWVSKWVLPEVDSMVTPWQLIQRLLYSGEWRLVYQKPL